MSDKNIKVTPPENAAPPVNMPPVGGMSPEQFAQFLAAAMAMAKSSSSEKDELETAELRLRAEERQRKINERKRAQMVQAKEIQEKAEERRMYQDILCSHKKPNGSPMLGGQHLSDGTLYQFCLFEKCGKRWLDGKDDKGLPMPHDLRMDNRLVGGSLIDGGLS